MLKVKETQSQMRDVSMARLSTLKLPSQKD
jgi:hypothetical protein